jgi:putative transposase
METEIRKKLKRREDFPSTRFITFSCEDRECLLRDPDVRDRFVERLILVRKVFAIELYEWVVMLNHVHLLLRATDPNVTMEAVLHRLKTKFAMDELKKLRDAGITIDHFWLPGGGYDRNICSNDEYQEKRDYIINNPVTAGLVARPEDWKWSSVGWPHRFWDRP